MTRPSRHRLARAADAEGEREAVPTFREYLDALPEHARPRDAWHREARAILYARRYGRPS